MGKFCLGWGVDGSRAWSVANRFSVLPGASGYSDGAVAESSVTRKLNEAFTFSRLQWGDNDIVTTTGKQLRLMKNGVASGLTATGPDSTAGPTWLPNSYTGGPISFAQNDTFAFNGVLSSNPFNGIKPYSFNTVIEASGAQVGLYTHQRLDSQSLMGSTNTTSYHALCSGDSVQNKTNNNQGVRISTAGTLKHAICYVLANASASDLHIKSYINGSTGNIDITIPAGATGEFTDFSNTDTLNVGDRVQWQATQATSGSVDVSFIGCSIESGTANTSDYFTHISRDSGVVITDVKSYTKAYGQYVKLSASSPIGVGIGFAATISGLWVDVEANALTGSQAFRWGFRKGSTDLGTFLTINQASGTGFIVDGTNSFNVGEDEEIAIWWEGDVYPGITIRAYGWTAKEITTTPTNSQAFIM